MQLRAQSIYNLCADDGTVEKWLRHPKTGKPVPMISPFVSVSRKINGKSGGLSVASYDVHIAHDLALERFQFALANTVEDFALPLNVSAQVCDKSTYARLGVSCFNTFFDPGFIGNATLELVNLSTKTIIIRAGDPIAQFVFQWLDGDADGYDGKYQFQRKQPVAAILEEEEPPQEYFR